jgi:hypothetical protein
MGHVHIRQLVRTASHSVRPPVNAFLSVTASGWRLEWEVMDRPYRPFHESREGPENRLASYGFFKPELDRNLPANGPQPPHESPRSVHVLVTKNVPFPVLEPARDGKQTKMNPGENLKPTIAHHKPPQMPKTRFIHSKVVRPQLLTLSSGATPTSRPSGPIHPRQPDTSSSHTSSPPPPSAASNKAPSP